MIHFMFKALLMVQSGFFGMDKIAAKPYCICGSDSNDYEGSGFLGCNVV